MMNVTTMCCAAECLDRDCSKHAYNKDNVPRPIQWKDYSDKCPDYIEPREDKDLEDFD